MKAQCLSSLDRISTLSSPLIENILSRLKIHEAARTSILSREWRYNWTRIPKLVFIDYWFNKATDEELPAFDQTFEVTERKKIVKICEIFYVIYQVLLMHQGPIHEFTLHMEVDNTRIEIDHIISHLSRNSAVKKLHLHLYEGGGAFYWIPSSIFSLHHLVDLHLYDCDLNHQPTFTGFGSLTTLYFKSVYIADKSLLHLLSNCPVLKTLTLLLHDENIICENKYTIIELLECLPMIEHLTTWDYITQAFAVKSVSRELPTSLIHLKYLSIDYGYNASNNGLYLLAHLIRCSPNLEKIIIEMTDDDYFDEINSSTLQKISDIRLEHLIELEIDNLGNEKPELEFVKFILAKSPVLKKVHLRFDNVLDKNEESEMLRLLLSSSPVSPVVKIS